MFVSLCLLLARFASFALLPSPSASILLALGPSCYPERRTRAEGGGRTLPVPLVDRVSLTLSSVLNVSELGEAGASDAEELCSRRRQCAGSLRPLSDEATRTVRQTA